MGCATIATLPVSIPQIQRFIDKTTNRASFTRGIPLINEGDFDTFFLGDIHQFLDEIGKPQITDLRPHRAFMPLRFKASRRISSYSSVSWWASFQWKSSRWRSILRCLRAKSSLVLSRLFDFFLVRECARFAPLIALRLRLKTGANLYRVRYDR